MLIDFNFMITIKQLNEDGLETDDFIHRRKLIFHSLRNVKLIPFSSSLSIMSVSTNAAPGVKTPPLDRIVDKI